MRPFDDADQAVSIVAIFFFIRAAFEGVPLLFSVTSLALNVILLMLLLLVVGHIAAGVGLLKSLRWAWPLGVGVTVLSVLDSLGLLGRMNLIGLLFDALILYLLFRPAVRERFGQLRRP